MMWGVGIAASFKVNHLMRKSGVKDARATPIIVIVVDAAYPRDQSVAKEPPHIIIAPLLIIIFMLHGTYISAIAVARTDKSMIPFLL